MLPTVAIMLHKPLPRNGNLQPLKEQLADYDNFRHRTWIASDVKCGVNNGVSIYYWGGGNCAGCERFAEYRFSNEGALLKSYLRPFRESDRQ